MAMMKMTWLAAALVTLPAMTLAAPSLQELAAETAEANVSVPKKADQEKMREATKRDFMFYMVKNKLLPPMDLSMTLHGPDKDEDGVRDDVMQFIKINKKPDAMRVHLVTAAREYQQIMMARKMTTKLAKSIYETLGPANACLMRSGLEVKIGKDRHHWVNVLEMFYGNTPEREERLMSFFEHVEKAGVSKLPEKKCA